MDRYIDLISQTFDFPTVEFKVVKNELYFHDIRLMDIINEYGTPLKLTYLPKISSQIQKSKRLFRNAMKKYDYKGEYTYCYCTKSSHFSFVLEESLKNDIFIETSSVNDLAIVKALYEKRKLEKDMTILCNGYKTIEYKSGITSLINDGFKNVLPILDTITEFDYYAEKVKKKNINIGIRVATDEEPKFQFYTSRLGIRPSDIIKLYKDKIAKNPKFKLKLLHFFVNTGIKDSTYYWNELSEFLHIYCELKQICPELDTLDIGGGFPIKNSLSFDYNYKYMAEQIIENIQNVCKEYNVPEPHIFTEFGSFTVGESGAVIYSVLDQKLQNDKEMWYMLDSSILTTLPDVLGLSQKFINLAINHWDKEYTRVNLGGITCDSNDYYNSEAHVSEIFLPTFGKKDQLYVGFFHTGAYQESVGGFGGIQHCLIPAPKHVIIDRDDDDNVTTRLFAPQQPVENMLKILGYRD
jgi:arginine decarboxylase